MYVRMTRVQAPPDKLKDSIQNFETNVLKRVKAAPGYQGAVLLVNRQTGDEIGVTYWESAKALGASEQAGIDARNSAVQNVAGTRIINVERSEVMIMERVGGPKAGTFVRFISGAGEPEKLDAGIGVGRNKALPVLKTLKGFRAMIASVDRTTGRTFVSTVWDTVSDLEASESKIAGVRAEFAKTAGISPDSLKVEVFEAAVVELSASLIAQTQSNRS
jgi:heme-degrading monooxygenase HmoA